jgi:O-antigen ligase
MCFAPVQGEIIERTIPASAHRQLEDSHSRDRMIIWLSYGQAIRAKPLLGSGFGTSATLHQHPVALHLPEKDRIWLAVGHPHSAQVQVWVETGLAGAALLLLAGLNLLVLIGRMPGLWRCAAFATFAGALAIAAVGHGAWQGWWIAALGASIAWFRVLMAQSRQDALSGKGAER